MAGTFTSTGSYSNLTRLELEQLRKADFFAAGKALAFGDAGNVSGGVGPGNVNAEPYYTGPFTTFEDVSSLTPLPNPGKGLLDATYSNNLASNIDTVGSEIALWYGPTYITRGDGAASSSTNLLSNALPTGGPPAPNDIVLIKPKFTYVDLNGNAVGKISVVGGSSGSYTLTLTDINNPSNSGNPTQLSTISAGTDQFTHAIVRPGALQLFAVPGSGPLGREQTFLFVRGGAGSTAIHNAAAPAAAAIESERVKNIVPPVFNSVNPTSAADRADSVFGVASAPTSLLGLGYRVVLYPDNGSGTGPDLTKPITSLNPVIDPGIAAGDQRMTIDYKAGVVRFSCAPAVGGDIKVSGGVNASTGRLNLYAVFWAMATGFTDERTKATASALYKYIPQEGNNKAPARIYYNSSLDSWIFQPHGTFGSATDTQIGEDIVAGGDISTGVGGNVYSANTVQAVGAISGASITTVGNATIGGNAYASSLTLDYDAWFGGSLAAAGGNANADFPRMVVQTNAPGTAYASRTLIMQTQDSGSSPGASSCVRMYVTGSGGLEIVTNAYFDNATGNWFRDSATVSYATKLAIGPDQLAGGYPNHFTISVKNTDGLTGGSSSWAYNQWDSGNGAPPLAWWGDIDGGMQQSQLRLGNLGGSNAPRLELAGSPTNLAGGRLGGHIKFAQGQSIPIGAVPEADTLYSKNLCRAWGLIRNHPANAITNWVVDSGFNVASVTYDSGAGNFHLYFHTAMNVTERYIVLMGCVPWNQQTFGTFNYYYPTSYNFWVTGGQGAGRTFGIMPLNITSTGIGFYINQVSGTTAGSLSSSAGSVASFAIFGNQTIPAT